MRYYPVVIPTLCRYEHFRKCVESLSRNIGADKTDLIIGLDYPPHKRYFEGYNKIKEFIKTINGFQNVIILDTEKNLGSIENTKRLIEYVSTYSDAYIYSEDDNEFSPFFLEYVNKGLETYRDDESILAVCGYSYPVNWNTEMDCVLQNQYFSAWGYGMWLKKRRDLQQNLNKKLILEEFNRAGAYKKWNKRRWNFINSLGLIFNEEIRMFDISYSFYMAAKDISILMPRRSLVINNGWDGTGEHYVRTKIDFGKEQRNNTFLPDVLSVDKKFYIELEKELGLLATKKDKAKNKIIFVLFKILGIKRLKKLKDIIRYGKK